MLTIIVSSCHRNESVRIDYPGRQSDSEPVSGLLNCILAYVNPYKNDIQLLALSAYYHESTSITASV